MLRVVLLVLALIAVSFAQQTRYDGFCVVRATNLTAGQIGELERQGFDIWARTATAVDVMLPVAVRSRYIEAGWKFSTMIEDVQAIIDQQALERLDRQRRPGLKEDWNVEYHTFEAIVEWTKELAAENPSLATFNPSVGTSIEGRSIVSISLHGGPSKRAATAAGVPQVVIIAGQHAREWIAPATTMYVLQKLVEGYGTDAEVTTILNAVNVTIVPIVNPDGYDYAWTNTRLWRKNRRRNSNGSYGVDLNRNWDDHWCEAGASTSPSSDTYCGTAPFSEPETKSVSAFIKNIAGLDNNGTAVKLALDMHSYSQLILRPYGWTTRVPPNDALLTRLGSDMASLIRATHGRSYTNQAAIDLYPTTGSAEDWFYSSINVPVTYTFELRDTGLYGFLLPPDQIIPTGEEIWAALEYLLHFTATN